jgi:hypothetical protein
MGDEKHIFVFGSNLAGRHGKGAARDAILHHGAVWGVGIGRRGNSYAIPTKNEQLYPLPLGRVKYFVKLFLRYARRHPELTFDVTPIGTGYAGFSVSEIAPLFNDKLLRANVRLPVEFLPYITVEVALDAPVVPRTAG